MRTLLWTLLVVLLAYVGLAAYLFFGQNKMIFLADFAGRELNGTPADIGLNYQDIHLGISGDARVHGWFIPHHNPRATLIYFHGNAGNIGGRLNSLARWHKLGVSTLIFDYPGYGQSEGQPTEQGTYEAARAAWQHLTQERAISADHIILFGRSLGGGVAAQLATEVNPKALIIESSFTSVPDIASEQYWFLPVRLLARIHYNSLKKLEQIRYPVLIIHSPEDEVIPFAHGQRLFEHANHPKQFLETKGGHNDGHVKAEPGYSQSLDRYLTELDR